MSFHVDLPPAKTNAFGFEAKALFEGGLAAELNRASSAEYTLPWQVKTATQYLSDLTGSSGKSGHAGHAAIGRHFSTRDGADSTLNAKAHGVLMVTSLAG